MGRLSAGLLQYAVWIGMGLFFVKLIGPVFNLAALPSLGSSLIFYLILFYILGFLLYSSIFAALGSAAEDESHLGQLSWPLIMVLVIPMVSVAAIITSPSSGFSVFLSLFPMTAPMVMFTRLLVSDPPTWQILLSVGLLLVSVFFLMLLSAKVFRIGILMTGKRFRLRDILRWLKA